VSDETAEPQQTEPAAPAADGASDDSVTLSGEQLKAFENSIWAKARKVYSKNAPAPDPLHDARVARGLKLLEAYDGVADRMQEENVRRQAVLDNAGPFGERVAKALGKGATKPQATSTAQPTGAPSELSQLLELMKLDVQSRLADKLPKPAVTYERAIDATHAGINADIAALDQNDPARHTKVQQIVAERLRGVKVGPVGSRVPVNPNKK
jgi:hypothetical protein